MNRHRAYVLAAGGVIGVMVLGTATLLFPHTDPGMIHAKAKLVGPGLVYRHLASDDTRWEVVLAGVRTGDLRWLRVAADLRPALDTHPAEEMLGAVSHVLDVNPLGAIQTLLPLYGASVVCGQGEEGVPIDRQRAERRERSLQSLALPELGACLTAIRQAQRGEGPDNNQMQLTTPAPAMGRRS